MRHIRIRHASKEKNQRYHAKIRALQHFGEQLTNLDLQKMAEIYRHSPQTKILERLSNRVTKAIIGYRDKAYPIIYDKSRHQIATILKPDYLSTEERKIYDNFQAMLVTKNDSFGNTVISEDVKIAKEEHHDPDVPIVKKVDKPLLVGQLVITEHDQEIMEEYFSNLNI